MLMLLDCRLQAPTPEIKTAWVNEIRKVLTQQLQACRGIEGTVSLSALSGAHSLINLSGVHFRSQSAEELRARFAESHQQQHLHLPQVGAEPLKKTKQKKPLHTQVFDSNARFIFIPSSPFRSSNQKNQKKQEEKKAEPSATTEANSSSPKHKGE